MAQSGWAAQTYFYKLNNGLKLLVREDHRAPLVVNQVWYRVGAVDEAWGHTGVSHALEHMMFKGTPNNPDGSFSGKINAVGGNQNAITSDDYTYYYQTVGAEHMPMVLQLEADRMQHTIFDSDAFASELEVVKEERSLKTDDRPSGVFSERFTAIANAPGPYAHTAIGWRADLDAMTMDQVQDWYQRWYVPNNVVIVVVGDVDAAQVHREVVKYFSAIPKKAVPYSRLDSDVRAWGKRQVEVQTDTTVPMVMMGYAVPSLNSLRTSEDPWALALLAAALGGSEGSGRLAKHVVRDKALASSAYAYYSLLQRGQTQFVLGGSPAPGHSTSELVAALQAQVRALQAQPLSPNELQKLKRQASADHVFSQDSVHDQAYLLGRLAVVGLPHTLADEWLEHVEAITAVQLQQAAKQYLQDDVLTIAVTQPDQPHATEGGHE